MISLSDACCFPQACASCRQPSVEISRTYLPTYRTAHRGPGSCVWVLQSSKSMPAPLWSAAIVSPAFEEENEAGYFADRVV